MAAKQIAPGKYALAIEIKGLFKAYGKKEVIKGLDLEVRQGEVFGFIGKNGVGKSTTIDCVIGCKKFQQGEITIMGHNILEEPLQAKKCFGYVPSEPNCYESMTGYEYLDFVASIYGVSQVDFANNTEYLAKRLDLSKEA